VHANGFKYILRFVVKSSNFSSYHWRISNITGFHTLDHFLDDFIFAGPSLSDECQVLINCFEETCRNLGIPIAEEKSVGPVTVIVFLGLEIDSNDMVIRVPRDKIVELVGIIQWFLLKNKVTL
jgi:hypothetical protein